MPTRIIKRPPPENSNSPLLVSFLLVGLAVSAIFWYGARLHTPDTEPTGQQLYNLYCAACHGYQGEGNTSLEAPALNSSGTTFEYSDGELQRAILTGGEIMPKHDQILTTTQAADIIRYMQTWWTEEQLAAQKIHSESDPLEP